MTFMLAAAAMLSFEGCLKNDESWNKYQSVMPGMTIYQLAMNQNTISLIPADAGMRMAILVAEALSQNPESNLLDLDEITVSNVRVLPSLFNSLTEVELLSDGNYRITFSDAAQQAGSGLVVSGSVLIQTYGTKSLAEGGSWSIVMENLTVSSGTSSSGSTTSKLLLESGATTIACDGAGVFTISVNGFRSHFDGNSIYSNWSGQFVVTAPDASMTYAKCSKKNFEVSGSAKGPTMYTADAILSQPLTINYTLTDGLYRGLQIIDGTQTCTLPNSIEYSASDFPAATVVYYWTYNESSNSATYQVSYNGSVYPK